MNDYPPKKYNVGENAYVPHHKWFRVPREGALIKEISWSVTFGRWSYLLDWNNGEKRVWFCETDIRGEISL